MRREVLENSPLTRNGKSLILAYDHGLEHGPSDFEEVGGSEDPERVFELAKHDAVTCLAVQKGLAETYYSEYEDDVSLLVKLNGNSSLWDVEPYSPKTCSVRYAVEELGADAVGYTVYAGSNREDEMFQDFREIQEEARKYDIPVVVWAYPRGENIGEKDHPSVIKYGSRIALELGADMIKAKYPGSRKHMRDVVNLTGEASVVMSGGSKTSDEEFLSQVQNVIGAGGNGVAVGRNVFQRKHPEDILDDLQEVIF